MKPHRRPIHPPPGPVTYSRLEIIGGENTLFRDQPLPPLVEPIQADPSDGVIESLEPIEVPGRSDPNSPLVPTQAEIEALPRGARQAFAARCARRVAPICWQMWPDAPAEHRAIVRWVVRVAEDEADSIVRRKAYDAIRLIYDYLNNGSMFNSHPASAVAAGTVAIAMMDDGPFDSFRAASWAAYALTNAATFSTPLTGQLRHIRRDFDRLAYRAEVNGWAGDIPVSPAVFGPMWVRGAPWWWTDEDEWRADAPLPDGR